MMRAAAVAAVLATTGWLLHNTATTTPTKPAAMTNAEVIDRNAKEAKAKGIKTVVPCSLRTPGLQYECSDNGTMRPAGPADKAQGKYFDACVAKGRSAYACLDAAAKVR